MIACFISSRAKPDLLGALLSSSYSSGSWLRLIFTLTWRTFSASQAILLLESAIDFGPLSWYHNGQEGRPAGDRYSAIPRRFRICRNAGSCCSGAGYFFSALMTPKTTTANKLSNPRISNVVMLSPPNLLWFGGLAVPLLLGPIIAWGTPFVNPLFSLFSKLFFPGRRRRRCAYIVYFSGLCCPSAGAFFVFGGTGRERPRLTFGARFVILMVMDFY